MSNNFNFLDFLRDPKQTSFSNQEQKEQKFEWKPYKEESNLSKPLSSEPIIPIVNISKFDSQVESPIYFEPEKLDENEEFKLVDDTVLTNVVPNRYIVSNYGRIYDIRAEKFMNPVSNVSVGSIKRSAYYRVKFSYVSDPESLTLKAKDIYIHRAVMKAFEPIDNSDEMDVDHKDSNHLNNRLDNLQWVSHEENQRLAVVRDEVASCENNGNAIYTNDEVHFICKALEGGRDFSYIKSHIPHATYATVKAIRQGSNYRRISSNYNIIKNNTPAKPNEILAEKICKMLEDGYRIRDICEILNVNRYMVADIKSGRNYVEISSRYNIPKPEVSAISEEKVHLICKYIENGIPNAEIANKLNISIDIVQRIKRGVSFKEISSQYSFPKESRSTYITDDTARKVCELLEKGYTSYAISKMSEIDATLGAITGIKRKQSFKHISKDYHF